MKKISIIATAFLLAFAVNSKAQTTPTQTGNGNGTPASESVGQTPSTNNQGTKMSTKGSKKSTNGSMNKSGSTKSSNGTKSSNDSKMMPPNSPTNPGTTRP